MGDSRLTDFELVERLAVRGAAELFLVEASLDGARVRIVLKRPRDSADGTIVDDAKVAMQLEHPKIVRTLDVGDQGGAPYAAMEYVDGIDLLGILNELARQRAALDPPIAVWIAREILDALDYAHARTPAIVHGRLSPTSVLLGASGDVKLGGFGIPRAVDVGTGAQDYGHTSPEQVMELPVDTRSDIFGVGVLLAEMLVGCRLFAAANEFDILLMVRDVRLDRFDARASRIGGELVAIVRAALERQPDRRWDLVAFRKALDTWLDEHHPGHDSKHRLAGLVNQLRHEVDKWRRGDSKTPDFDLLHISEPPAPPKPQPRALVVPSMKTIAIPPRPKTPPLGAPIVRVPDAPAQAASADLQAQPTPADDDFDFDLADELEEVRPQARGTVQPKEEAETRIARGTVEPAEVAEPATFRVIDNQPTIRRIKLNEAEESEPSDPRAERMKPGERERLSTERLDARPRAIQDPGSDHAARAAAQPASKPSPDSRMSTRGALHPQRKIEDVLPARTPVETPTPPRKALTQAEPIPAKLANLDRASSEHGAFSRVSPLRVLFRLMSTNATGLLSATRKAVQRDIYVRDGQLAGVWSSDPRELFGKYLVSEGVISEGELAMTLATVAHYGGKIGDTLVELGLMKRLELFRHLTKHTAAKVIDVCKWDTGQYTWSAGVEDPRESFALGVEGVAVLGEAALALDRQVIETWLQAHSADPVALVKPQRGSVVAFRLRGTKELVAEIDGIRTVEELAKRRIDRAQPLHAARVLFLLFACELVRAA